jgi:hypothetical protein
LGLIESAHYSLKGLAMCASDPDPRVAEAAMEAQKISREQFEWSREVYKNDIKPAQLEQQKYSRRATELSLGIAEEQAVNSREDRKFGLENFRPIEQNLTKQAMEFNSPDYAARKAQDAGANVETEFADAMGQTRRSLARQGIALSGEQNAAQMADAAIKKAAIKAGTMNTARDNAELLGYARQLDVAKLGRGLSGDSSAAAQTALSANNSGINSISAPINSMNQSQAQQGQAGAQRVQGQFGVTNALAQQDGQRMQAEQSNQATAGAVVGTVAMIAI